MRVIFYQLFLSFNTSGFDVVGGATAAVGVEFGRCVVGVVVGGYWLFATSSVEL